MACDLNAIINQLRDKGWRLTPQRQMLLEALHAAEGHIDAETLWEQMVRRFPTISLSTVYRTLESLRDLGAATETDLGLGRVQYHLASHGDHHHLLCRQCGVVLDLPSEELAPLRQRLLARYGFDLGVNHLALRGLCSGCR
ncbi:MAG TPA: Fur family transcriptional regulator [Armatimonadota bacterium]